MKKPLIATGFGLFVLLMMACGGLSNEEACNKVESLCNSSKSTADGGATATVTVTCKPENFDKMSNDSDVKECIDKAGDCNAAVKCMADAKPE